jgi:hypothetical protein
MFKLDEAYIVVKHHDDTVMSWGLNPLGWYDVHVYILLWAVAVVVQHIHEHSMHHEQE